MSEGRFWLHGFRFRSARPRFAAGEEIEAHVYPGPDGTPAARIGDSLLRVDGAEDVAAGDLVKLRVTAFDPERGEGRAERA